MSARKVPCSVSDMAIRVLTGDAQPLFRDAVARTIRQRSAFELVGEVADGRAALAAIVALRPDVAVLDLPLPELDGDRVLRAVRRDGLPTRILFLCAGPSPDRAYRALEDGAAGLLTKYASADQLCEAIGAAARGETILSREVVDGVAHEIRLRAGAGRVRLTDRERAILRLIADGRTLPAIGRELHLARATVKTHVAHIYEKLEVSERAAAVAEAMRRGLLE
jgi:two-component system, NarL family, nitrate/nitrite response regulator NarL